MYIYLGVLLGSTPLRGRKENRIGQREKLDCNALRGRSTPKGALRVRLAFRVARVGPRRSNIYTHQQTSLWKTAGHPRVIFSSSISIWPLLSILSTLVYYYFCCCSLITKCVWLFVTPWTVASTLGFLRQEYWSELPFPPPGDLPDPGMDPCPLSLLLCRLILYHCATRRPILLLSSLI